MPAGSCRHRVLVSSEFSVVSARSHVLEMKGCCTLHCKWWAVWAVLSQMKNTNGKVTCLGGQNGKSLTHRPNWSARWPCTLCVLVPTNLIQVTARVHWCWLLWCSRTAHQSLGHPSEDSYRQDPQGCPSWHILPQALLRPQGGPKPHSSITSTPLWTVQWGVAALLILWLLLQAGSLWAPALHPDPVGLMRHCWLSWTCGWPALLCTAM